MSPACPPGASRLATYFHVHLVSDSTGETLNAMAKAVIARFDGVIPIEHIYALVRSNKQMERVLEEVAAARGVVLDRKSTRLNSSHVKISYAVFCLKKKE